MSDASSRGFRLADLAARGDARLSAPDAGETVIVGACALSPGRAGHIAYALAEAPAAELAATRAAAVVTTAERAGDCGCPALVADAPRLAYARLARAFEPPAPAAGRHPGAVVGPGAAVAATASLGPGVVIGADAAIGAAAVVGANAVIGDGVAVGEGARIDAGACLYAGTGVGARCHVHANAVLGARGFGLERGALGFEPVPQLGGVRVGVDVEIGAGTTVDRGTFDDTVIADGVKIDAQVHIGHNCRIGEHSVIAGCVGLAGSVRVGRFCLIGGGAGLADHVVIADGVVITAATQVARSIDAAGVYSSGMWAMPAVAWRRCMARFRGLEAIERRLRRLEKAHTSARGG